LIGTRDEFFRDVLPVGSEIAELGVFLGSFSDVILKLNRPSRLWLVDPWESLTYECCDTNNSHTIVVVNAHHLAAWAAQKYQHWPEVTVCRETSHSFLSKCPKLDCVYIDTSHDYESTAQELAASLQVVRHGGWIGGHDLNLTGVAHAVREFRETYTARIQSMIVTTGEVLPSFFMRIQ
jgi:hypothetical protein